MPGFFFGGWTYLAPGFSGSGTSGLKTGAVPPLGRWAVNRSPGTRSLLCRQENSAGSSRPFVTVQTPRSATTSGEIPDSSNNMRRWASDRPDVVLPVAVEYDSLIRSPLHRGRCGRSVASDRVKNGLFRV